MAQERRFLSGWHDHSGQAPGSGWAGFSLELGTTEKHCFLVLMASPQQSANWRPPEKKFYFNEVNPDKVRDKNPLSGLPPFWPIEVAEKNALIYVNQNRTIESQIGRTFHLSPPSGNVSLASYARHLVEADGTGRTSPTKVIGLRSIGKTLKNPSFCLRDDRHGTDLYCRVYINGEVHVVVVDPTDLRVITQFVYNDKTNKAICKMLITHVRGDWE